MAEDVKFCPICGCKLHVDGERLLCDRHGEMKAYLERNPKASAAVAEACDALGIENLGGDVDGER